MGKELEMTLSRMAPAILVVALAVASVASAERITLKSGQEIKAPVLKQDAKTVVIDLGTTALSLNRADVDKIESDAPAAADAHPASATGTGAAAAEKSGPQWQLYRSAVLTPATIEKNVENFGEGVVMVTTPAGQGSGFFINADGYLITNYHVIARETRIKVTVFCKTAEGFEQKPYKTVKIVAINPVMDLALLKIESPGTTFKYVYLGDGSDVVMGRDCFAIGNPLGLTRTVSQGIVSTANRNIGGQLYIQTTASVNPGNSGGPLFNLKGEVIGVTSMGYLAAGGLNFAIPADVVRRFVDNRDAFAFAEDNPNSGFRYPQPVGRSDHSKPPAAALPSMKDDSK
jgi:serine protease Do